MEVLSNDQIMVRLQSAFPRCHVHTRTFETEYVIACPNGREAHGDLNEVRAPAKLERAITTARDLLLLH